MHVQMCGGNQTENGNKTRSIEVVFLTPTPFGYHIQHVISFERQSVATLNNPTQISVPANCSINPCI